MSVTMDVPPYKATWGKNIGPWIAHSSCVQKRLFRV